MVVLLNGEVVATLDSNIDPQFCGDDPGYSYQPNAEGTYVVQFRTAYQSPYAVVAQVEFQVGVNENGSPVGGEIVQINAPELPATWITLSLVIASVVASAVLLVKKLES